MMTEFAIWILIAVSTNGNFAPTKLEEFKDRNSCESLQRHYEALSERNSHTNYRCAPATVIKR